MEIEETPFEPRSFASDSLPPSHLNKRVLPMFAGSLLLSATVLGFTGWLFYHERRGWPEDSQGSKLDQDYLTRRHRNRARIHFLFLLTGILIAVAGFAGQGRIWLACWMVVILILVTVVPLAMMDAWRTHRYMQKKLPEVRRRMMGEE